MKLLNHINFKLIDEKDADFIILLRGNSAKNKFISKTNISIDHQIDWIRNYKKREKENHEFYYVIQEQKKNLGLVRLYDFKKNSFCWGSWIIIDEAPIYTAIESALKVYEIAFYDLNFKQSHFDVRKTNKKVVNFHKKFGAKIINDDEENYFFTFKKTDYEKVRIKYKKFFR